ncbi:MAG: histidine phosphatase family protein [Actinomycetia bacterium]|nr:histidine phosphatase family protein [Actinomycetes bacterium]
MAKDPHGLLEPNRSTKLLLMRHPQTVKNVEARYQGRSNAPLSELGREQCTRAVKGLVAWQPEKLYSSPLSRCLAIAEPVAEALGLELQIDERLLEIDFGAVEGFTHDEAIAQGLSFPWDPSTGPWPVSGAEPLEDFVARTAAVASDLAALEGRIAAVTHGGAVRGIFSCWMHIPVEHLWMMSVRNVESSCFSVDAEGLVYLDAHGLKPEWLSKGNAA